MAVIPLRVVAATGSSNDDLWEAYREGERGPVGLLALRQGRGRGSRGRSWWSGDPGNLHLSALFLLPAASVARLPFVPLAAALCVATLLRRYAEVPIGVKWPNDLTVAGRKLGGVLAESRNALSDGRIPVVVGIGVNVNGEPEAFPEELRRSVVTLRELAGRRLPLVDIARGILYTLGDWFGELSDPGGGATREAAP